MSRENNGIKRLVIPVVVLLIISCLMGACSSSQSDADQSFAGSGSAADTAGDAEMSLEAAEPAMAAEETLAVEATSPDSANRSADGGSSEDEAGGSGGSGAPVILTGSEGFDRKLVYRANLTMEVEDFGKATTTLRTVIHQNGGYMTEFADSRSEHEISANYTIKVPAESFTSFIEQLERMEHRLFEQQIKGTDVTEEYVDLEARLRAKQVVEERLLAFMDQAQQADDLVRFSEQLGSVQEEIERIKGRIRYLDENVAYSTIELRLYEPSALMAGTLDIARPLGGRMADALTTSVTVLVNLVEGLLVVGAGALPVLVLAAVVGTPIVWGIRRKSRAGRSVQPTPKALPDEEKGGES